MPAEQELAAALGILPHSARLYFAALQHGEGTLTELARHAKLSRTITQKPISELIENGLLIKRLAGKRIRYAPINPQQLPSLIEKRKQRLVDLSNVLLQQISAAEQDLQVRWYSGMAGIHTAMREFYGHAKGPLRHFEHSETYRYVGHEFGDAMLNLRIKRGVANHVIIVTNNDADPWYRGHMARDKEELRESLLLSAKEYPFTANIGAGENMVMIFEYQEKPFALIIENRFVAQSIRAAHKMVWDRYRS